ncbi:DUF1963 domain-containing protein [Bradyrhizobium lablabi]|uniref:YwqG family protein n=1 Tax=Bradyrhizobium lablabi TaxID=722472 RepID=UPI001BA851FE|nr:YwqG family protein [Bradyrhizobium lablabi]MBR1120457.1 DUF1963 domain-containing protein [Bradyrhizobium lablabi]
MGEHAAGLARMARYSIMLAPGPIDETNMPLGSSRLGGEPDLPVDFDWPMRPAFEAQDNWTGPIPGRLLLGPSHWLHRLLGTEKWKQASQAWQRARDAERSIRNRDWPLSFVAQIDFAELHAVHALDGFPSSGRLLLFCDPFDWPWGEKADQARTRAIYTEQPLERLQRRRAPPEFAEPEARQVMPRGFVFKPRLLRPAAWLMPPPLRSCALDDLRAERPGAWKQDGPAFSAYRQFWDDLHARHPDIFAEQGQMIHQVGGSAFSIQEPVERETARLTADASATAEDWQLVLQISSDVDAGMEWGDTGRLYLSARKQDLAARRFDQCWMLMQCY